MGVLAFGVKSQGNHLLCVRYQSNGEKDMNHVMSAKLTGLEIHCRNALSTAHKCRLSVCEGCSVCNETVLLN